MSRILIVEDDPNTCRAIEIMLNHAGYETFKVDCGADAIDLAVLFGYDLITLDLGLPDMSGHEVLRQLRIKSIITPVLVLSAADDTENKLRAFGNGADDYVTKPFHREELLARIKVILRRNIEQQWFIRVGDLAINTREKIASLAGKIVHLTAKEYEMLELFAMRLGVVLTKEMIMDHLYKGTDQPELKIIDVFVCKLRKKLSAAVDKGTDGTEFIETMWGRGYVMKAR